MAFVSKADYGRPLGDLAKGRIIMEAMVHRFALRVYYEDTDLAGIVYYANYLKFIERGRSEWLRDLGIDQMRIKADTGVVFAVRRLEADYLRPAQFGDDLLVETVLAELGGSRIALAQQVLRDGVVLFDAKVLLACIGPRGPARLPLDLRARLQGQAPPLASALSGPDPAG